MTNTIVGNVCGNAPSCCASGGRWSLSCVQMAASYAKQNNLAGGDFCGRFAWAQGPIPGTGQYYPRDFNLIAVAGGINGLRDVEGPVGAAGGVSFAAFNLNIKRREPVALLAGGGAFITQGTIYGNVVYGNTLSDPQVTFFDSPTPNANPPVSNPFPVNFDAVCNNLVAMSQALQRYDAIPATKQYSTITFTGTDPELNVFSLASSALSGATAYTFNVPQNSSVIVNVTGADPSFRNAGFVGAIPPQLLWNFPNATMLTLNGVGFMGSILAPQAAANMQNGSVTGTAVVGSAGSAMVEFYSVPFRIPACRGGLCLDATWSSTAYVSDDGTAADLANEAGFLQITGGSYVAENQSRFDATNRIWYSFLPAQIQPKTKPLAVFFNGGPGSATSAVLFAFNTGPWTLDPDKVGSARIIPNSASYWGQFANLLYIDAPATGFSYPLANSTGCTGANCKPDLGIDIDRDAGDFDRVILRFLQRHPQIRQNRVVLVGESYGGTRATFMLNYLFNYTSIAMSGSPYIDLQLNNDETSYFLSVFGTPTPSTAQIASKFGHQVLIEPAVIGHEQYLNLVSSSLPNGTPEPTCLAPKPGDGACTTMIPGTTGTADSPPTCDEYDCMKPFGWSDGQEQTAASRLVSISVLNTAIGADVRLIEWMKASSRTNAYGRNDGTIVQSNEMTATFGTLGPEDNYFLRDNNNVFSGFKTARQWNSTGAGLISGTAFVNNLHNGVSTFLTVSQHDTIVWSPQIPLGMAYLQQQNPTFAMLISGVGYDPMARTVLPRPGTMSLTYTSNTDQRVVTMPHYYDAGHSVTIRGSTDLLADVLKWYPSTPH